MHTDRLEDTIKTIHPYHLTLKRGWDIKVFTSMPYLHQHRGHCVNFILPRKKANITPSIYPQLLNISTLHVLNVLTTFFSWPVLFL